MKNNWNKNTKSTNFVKKADPAKLSSFWIFEGMKNY